MMWGRRKIRDELPKGIVRVTMQDGTVKEYSGTRYSVGCGGELNIMQIFGESLMYGAMERVTFTIAAGDWLNAECRRIVQRQSLAATDDVG